MYEIEHRLVGWAHYKLDLNNGHIGYPSKNIILSINGGSGARYPTTGTCLIYKYSDHQQTEGWIREMGREFPHFEDVINIYYTTRWQVIDVARFLGISKRTLMQRVHDAKLWLSGRLAALQGNATQGL